MCTNNIQQRVNNGFWCRPSVDINAHLFAPGIYIDLGPQQSLKHLKPMVESHSRVKAPFPQPRHQNRKQRLQSDLK